MMRFKKAVLSLAAVLSLSGVLFAADTYELDVAHSNVGFSVKHMVLSNTRGFFQDFSGSVILDEKNMAKSSVKVKIKTASINTGNAKRDEHLASPDFFDAQKYPEITFVSKKVEKQGDGYLLTGDFTMHGVTKEISFPFTLAGPMDDPWGGRRFGAEGGLTINRQDYGVSWNKALDNGGVVVGNDVKIELAIEAVKAAKK